MQPLSELRLHPINLRTMGTTPSGAAVYRVVWADSRKSVAYRGNNRLVTGRYQHGAEAALQGKWILEKWLPAAQYYGMDAEAWDALQRTAVEKQKYTPSQESEVGRFLSTLDPVTRAQIEARLSPTLPDPVVEPYSHEGEYEFAGLYFERYVDEAYLRKQVEAHVYRLKHTTEGDRQVEREQKDIQQKKADDETFDELFEVTRQETLSAA